jgi:hypothetical protein
MIQEIRSKKKSRGRRKGYRTGKNARMTVSQERVINRLPEKMEKTLFKGLPPFMQDERWLWKSNQKRQMSWMI